jgi:hypothetical protein
MNRFVIKEYEHTYLNQEIEIEHLEASDLPNILTYLLTYGAEPVLRSCQLCSH